MRKIKFRAWNELTKIMIDLKKITPLALSLDTDGLFIPFSDGLPLMQYTGLIDKNGKEIYESDLLKDNQGDIREVIFEDGGFWCKYPNGQKYMPSEEFREVIGNVYENSELLKEK
ncbi:YopX family protein [Candidatus Oleimmundimicrobium sp.]|uniref:YopX family protein n=1 Tax=Candidatus Oleimmundimicrobium sp. TaxID=3060597 RepID=UPI002727E195|nr:YopX family protein [Candidatus Oleimmundimicrobium sp.]MDO8885752.1 YopX family protein [Candidatus Oleimmundimicrobium sp.]